MLGEVSAWLQVLHPPAVWLWLCFVGAVSAAVGIGSKAAVGCSKAAVAGCWQVVVVVYGGCCFCCYWLSLLLSSVVTVRVVCA